MIWPGDSCRVSPMCIKGAGCEPATNPTPLPGGCLGDQAMRFERARASRWLGLGLGQCLGDPLSNRARVKARDESRL